MLVLCNAKRCLSVYDCRRAVFVVACSISSAPSRRFRYVQGSAGCSSVSCVLSTLFQRSHQASGPLCGSGLQTPPCTMFACSARVKRYGPVFEALCQKTLTDRHETGSRRPPDFDFVQELFMVRMYLSEQVQADGGTHLLLSTLGMIHKLISCHEIK